MNQAQSGRLRMRCLLLLAPLLVASTPSPLTVTNGLVLAQSTQPLALVFLNPPRELLVDRCTPLKVGVRDGSGQAAKPGAQVPVTLSSTLLIGGSFHQGNTCTSPIDSVTIPADVTEVEVWYKSSLLGGLTLTASDGSGGLIDATAGPISVVISLTNRLELTAPQSVMANVPFDVTVTAFNLLGQARGYAGTIRLSSSPPVPGLPLDYTFNPTVDDGDRVFPLTLPPGGPYVLTVQDINNSNIVDRATISVQAPPGTPKVSLFARASQAATCEPVTLDVTVLNSAGNPDPGASAEVKLCRSGNSQALPIDRSFGDAASDGSCVSGTVMGTGSVTWMSTHWEDTWFTISLADSTGPANVSWRPRLNPELSSFSFVNNANPVPMLARGAPPVTVQLNLSDTCPTPQPMVLPQDKPLTFSAGGGLSVGTPQVQPGQWTATVRLQECPADLTQRLAIRPMIGGAPIPKPGGGPLEQLELFIQPLCTTSAELSIYSLLKDEEVAAGEPVLFEVEFENKGEVSIRDGVLMLSVSGMTAVEASTASTVLMEEQGGFPLPELLPNSKLRVSVKAVATPQLNEPLMAKVQFLASDGTPLTDEEHLSFKREELDVNVGCGCHAAGLPSQLLPWLALLLAASRPWERLRRLRRAERIDRQAPW